jgi:hypothetical protein
MPSTPPNTPEIYQTYLVGQLTPTLTFAVPLPVVIEVTETGYAMADEVFMRYGAGETAREALAAYLDDLEGYRQLLEQSAANYPEDARLLQTLYDYLGQAR